MRQLLRETKEPKHFFLFFSTPPRMINIKKGKSYIYGKSQQWLKKEEQKNYFILFSPGPLVSL
jgi:hypothetical protein